jgi:hypothetical protein
MFDSTSSRPGMMRILLVHNFLVYADELAQRKFFEVRETAVFRIVSDGFRLDDAGTFPRTFAGAVIVAMAHLSDDPPKRLRENLDRLPSAEARFWVLNALSESRRPLSDGMLRELERLTIEHPEFNTRGAALQALLFATRLRPCVSAFIVSVLDRMPDRDQREVVIRLCSSKEHEPILRYAAGHDPDEKLRKLAEERLPKPGP